MGLEEWWPGLTHILSAKRDFMYGYDDLVLDWNIFRPWCLCSCWYLVVGAVLQNWHPRSRVFYIIRFVTESDLRLEDD